MDTFEFNLIISCYKGKRLLEYTNLFSPIEDKHLKSKKMPKVIKSKNCKKWKKKWIATAPKFVGKDCKSGVSQEIFLDKKVKNGPSELPPTSLLWLKRTWCWEGQF